MGKSGHCQAGPGVGCNPLYRWENSRLTPSHPLRPTLPHGLAVMREGGSPGSWGSVLALWEVEECVLWAMWRVLRALLLVHSALSGLQWHLQRSTVVAPDPWGP